MRGHVEKGLKRATGTFFVVELAGAPTFLQARIERDRTRLRIGGEAREDFASPSAAGEFLLKLALKKARAGVACVAERPKDGERSLGIPILLKRERVFDARRTRGRDVPPGPGGRCVARIGRRRKRAGNDRRRSRRGFR